MIRQIEIIKLNLLVFGVILFVLVLYSASAFAAPSLSSVNCGVDGTPACLSSSNNIVRYINVAINFVSIGIGIIATAMIIVAGIQYITANGEPAAITAAKTRITNVIIGLVSYFFIYAFIEWLIPGGFLG